MSDTPNILYNVSKPLGHLPRTFSNELWRFVWSKINFSHILSSKWSKITENGQKCSKIAIFDHFEDKICEKSIFDNTNLHNSLEQVRGRCPGGFESLYNIFRGSDIDFHVKIVIFDF